MNTNPKHPLGRANLHVTSSNGPSSDNLHFYSTSYSVNYKGGEGAGLGKNACQR